MERRSDSVDVGRRVMEEEVKGVDFYRLVCEWMYLQKFFYRVEG